MQIENTQQPHLKQLTLHVGDEPRLVERAREKLQPTEIVVAPVELHQRNLQRRLRDANAPKDAFRFRDFGELSRSVLADRGFATEALDRIDRLAAVRDLLEEAAESAEAHGSLPARVGNQDPKHVEQIRAEVESATNFHPKRIAAWHETAERLYEPLDGETGELLDTAVEIERRLRRSDLKAVSEAELVRRATRTLIWSNGYAWEQLYSDVSRLTVVGLSSISATQADFVHALLVSTSLDVHLHFRRRTGEYLKGRVPELLEIENPGRGIFE